MAATSRSAFSSAFSSAMSSARGSARPSGFAKPDAGETIKVMEFSVEPKLSTKSLPSSRGFRAGQDRTEKFGVLYRSRPNKTICNYITERQSAFSSRTAFPSRNQSNTSLPFHANKALEKSNTSSGNLGTQTPQKFQQGSRTCRAAQALRTMKENRVSRESFSGVTTVYGRPKQSRRLNI